MSVKMSDEAPPAVPSSPSLYSDKSFWSMTTTQFLGAFNDNLFKQVILLLCVDYALQQGGVDKYQPIAQVLFALPFILFSGFAGYLSDRYSKQRIVVLCKLAEILIVLAGTLALSLGGLTGVFVVVFLMGTHSAYFGPPKYGILPEIVAGRNLPVANGIFLMTTFLAIILGTASAGFLKGYVPDQLGFVGSVFVGIAVLGTISASLVRKTPASHPNLPFSWSSLAVSGETVRMFWRDKTLLSVLLVYSLFWLIAGVVPQAVNAFGKLQLFVDVDKQIADQRTSLMTACLGVGIMLGSALAAWLSGPRVNFKMVIIAAWGILFSMAAVTGVGMLPWSVAGIEWGARGALVLVGVFGAMFSVPLQVFLQARPPADQKGRAIGAMNLINWIGVVLASAVYGGCEWLFRTLEWNTSATFAAVGLLMLPVALWYRPVDGALAE